MDMRGMKMGDTFVAVALPDPGRKSEPARLYHMMVLSTKRRYLYANEVGTGYRESVFDLATGYEKTGYRPMIAYPDEAAFRTLESKRKRIAKLRAAVRDMSYTNWERLQDDDLDVLEALLGKLK